MELKIINPLHLQNTEYLRWEHGIDCIKNSEVNGQGAKSQKGARDTWDYSIGRQDLELKR